MNNSKPSVSQNEQKNLEILNLIHQNGLITQQEIADHLGVAIGLVNSFVKRMVKRGYIRIKRVPKRRYLYLLTPKGVSEKGRLTVRFIRDSLKLYRDYRAKCKVIFRGLVDDGIHYVYLVGVEELAEIAYLSLQEIGVDVAGVYDMSGARIGKKFFGNEIMPMEKLPREGIVVMAELLFPSDADEQLDVNWIDLRM